MDPASISNARREHGRIARQAKNGGITEKNAEVARFSDKKPFPLAIDGQKLVLMSTSHTANARIRNRHGAAFRVVATVDRAEDALSILKEFPALAESELVLHPTHAWKLIINRELGEAAQLARIEELLHRNADRIKSAKLEFCLLYTSPSPRDVEESRMPSSA